MQKLIFDLFPVALFFIAYKLGDIYTATATIIIAMAAQLIWLKLRKKPIEKMQAMAFIAVLVLGGLTLALRNPNFILWKPTIVNALIASVFMGSEWVGKQPLVQKFMGPALDLTDRQWLILNRIWVGFFAFCGAINLVVAYNFSENTWVNFRLFGLTALNIAFMVIQILILRKHLIPLEEEEKDKTVLESETKAD